MYPVHQSIQQMYCPKDRTSINQSINSFLFPHSTTLETHVHYEYCTSAEKGTRSKTGNHAASPQQITYTKRKA